MLLVIKAWDYQGMDHHMKNDVLYAVKVVKFKMHSNCIFGQREEALSQSVIRSDGTLAELKIFLTRQQNLQK